MVADAGDDAPVARRSELVGRPGLTAERHELTTLLDPREVGVEALGDGHNRRAGGERDRVRVEPIRHQP